MANKKIRIGALMVEEKQAKDGRKWNSVYLGLGQKGKNEQYNNSVEVIVRDSKGNVIHSQTDGFLSLTDPRKEPDELLAAKLISEEQHAKMKERLEGLPAKIKHQLFVTSK